MPRQLTRLRAVSLAMLLIAAQQKFTDAAGVPRFP